MRHGQGANAGLPPPDDLYLGRVYANMQEYAALEAAFCSCDALCTCGWDAFEAEQ